MLETDTIHEETDATFGQVRATARAGLVVAGMLALIAVTQGAYVLGALIVAGAGIAWRYTTPG